MNESEFIIISVRRLTEHNRHKKNTGQKHERCSANWSITPSGVKSSNS